jgi:[ribosomal protein S5]-alanine N-acetyltransferase
LPWSIALVEAITCERLVMRRARMADAAAMHAILSDPAAMTYWSTLPHTSAEQTEEWMRGMVEAPPDSDDFILEVGDRVIGKLGCWRLPEIGYILAPHAWGHGYAGEALAAFIAHRRRAGGTELTADTDPANSASIRLLQRHGFVETGRAERTWLIGGKWHDSIYWRLAL